MSRCRRIKQALRELLRSDFEAEVLRFGALLYRSSIRYRCAQAAQVARISVRAMELVTRSILGRTPETFVPDCGKLFRISRSVLS